MTSYLGIADYLLVAEAVLDVPAEVLVDVCDLALVESALSAAAATFGGTDLYPSMAAKAAALTYRMCNNHPLLDGNKRVAYECLRGSSPATACRGPTLLVMSRTATRPSS